MHYGKRLESFRKSRYFQSNGGRNVCAPSTDDVSERSLRKCEVSRDQTSLEEEREEDGFSLGAQTGEFKAEHANAENQTINRDAWTRLGAA